MEAEAVFVESHEGIVEVVANFLESLSKVHPGFLAILAHLVVRAEPHVLCEDAGEGKDVDTEFHSLVVHIREDEVVRIVEAIDAYTVYCGWGVKADTLVGVDKWESLHFVYSAAFNRDSDLKAAVAGLCSVFLAIDSKGVAEAFHRLVHGFDAFEMILSAVA